jgi:hypothetical protein
MMRALFLLRKVSVESWVFVEKNTRSIRWIEGPVVRGFFKYLKLEGNMTGDIPNLFFTRKFGFVIHVVQ